MAKTDENKVEETIEEVNDKLFKCPVCNQNVRAELGIAECPVCGQKFEVSVIQ